MEALIWYEKENKMIQECNAAQLFGRWKRRLWDQFWFLVLQRFMEWKSLERDSFLSPEASHSALTSPPTRQERWTCACVTLHSECCGVLTEHDCKVRHHQRAISKPQGQATEGEHEHNWSSAKASHTEMNQPFQNKSQWQLGQGLIS